MELLRFLTAGSVDDGKSTLIGRLLYDSQAVSGDILAAIERSTKNKADGPDLSLLTDGLRAEREQGITIDVAYKYFSTAQRKFIIADAPGHVQYTRNMVTAASTAQLVIILIDARVGVVEQTKRHSLIAALLGIPNVVVAINKMDLVNYSETVFHQIHKDYELLADKLGLKKVIQIPISAKDGDNVVNASSQMPWYTGKTLLQILETAPTGTPDQSPVNTLQVQYVIRPNTDELHDYRGFAGTVLSGEFRPGDEIAVLPSGVKTKIKAIHLGSELLQQAAAGQAITIQLENQMDISRGDTLVAGQLLPEITQEFGATICWMDHKPLTEGAKYILQHNSNRSRVAVKQILHQIDIETYAQIDAVESLGLNALGRVLIKSANPLVLNKYSENKNLGSAILIDETTHATVGVLMID